MFVRIMKACQLGLKPDSMFNESIENEQPLYCNRLIDAVSAKVCAN